MSRNDWMQLIKKGLVVAGLSALGVNVLKRSRGGQELLEKAQAKVREILLGAEGQNSPTIVVVPMPVVSELQVGATTDEFPMTMAQIVDLYHQLQMAITADLARNAAWLVTLAALKFYQQKETDPVFKQKAQDALTLIEGMDKDATTQELVDSMMDSTLPYSPKQVLAQEADLRDILSDRKNGEQYNFPRNQQEFMKIWLDVLQEMGDLTEETLGEMWMGIVLGGWDRIFGFFGKEPGIDGVAERVQRANQLYQSADPEIRRQIDETVAYIKDRFEKK